MPLDRPLGRLTGRTLTTPPPSPAQAKREIKQFLERLGLLIAALAAIVLAGGVALAAFEGGSYWHGLVWSFDIVATTGSVGQPDTIGGDITKFFIIALGVGTFLYILVTAAELFVAGHLSGILEVRRMQRKINDLKDHYLICGFGRVGQQVARDFLSARVAFVVIDPNPDTREDVEEMGVLHIERRASDDDTLLDAGIMKARGILACVDSDAENIFITLTARELRPDLQVVARASDESSERKLLRAGANKVISPYKTSGRAMAELALGKATTDSDESDIAAETAVDVPLSTPQAPR
jgi:voltage-gated potassium channel